MSVELAQEIDINRIRIDGDTQPRAALNYDAINDYAQSMREGDIFPPIVVYWDGENYWLSEGFHRYHGTKLVGRHVIAAEVRKGDRRQAKWDAYSANKKNGIRMTTADKQKIVTEILLDPEWSQYPNAVIARHCGVDKETVRKYRNTQIGEIRPLGHIEIEEANDEQRSNISDNWNKPQPAMPLLPFQEAAREELAQEEESSLADRPSENAIAYAEKIKQRVEDAWFKERGLDKDQPEAQEALRIFIEQNAEEDDEEEEWEPRYDGEHDAYCKYCYKTHKKWQLDEDAWLCEYCNHRTADQFMQIEDVEPSEPQKDFYRRQGVPAALLTSETNEWFTPPQYVDMARKLMGEIDLDPASNAYANEKVVQATDFYDIQTNGLDKEWHGRVWLNPPYGRDEGGSNQEAWSRRLIEQYETGITKEAVLLVNANTEAKWFQPLYNYPICFTNHRIRFYNTEGTPSQPTQGNAFIYFGNRPERFVELFSTFGVVIRRIDK